MSSDAQIARQWAESFIKHADSAQIVDAAELTAARYILATTQSLTMTEAEWDDEVHAGMCAEHPKHGVVRMMHEVEEGETIDCILPDMSLLVIRAEELTPLPGTRVDLTPRRESAPESTPDHPEVLATQEDYENAPTGTIVASGFSDPWVKDYMGFWLGCGADEGETSSVMVRFARRVLRWGEAL